MSEGVGTLRIKCPTCRRELEVAADHPSRPFCTNRCKMADLGKWLDGEYRLSRPMSAEDASDVDFDDG